MIAEGARLRARRAWWTVGVWLVFQLTLTSLPGQTLPNLRAGFRIDWLAHFCIYFGLGVLVARAGLLHGWTARRLALTWVTIAVFAALDELHQRMIPNRSGEVIDWIMDASGSWLGLVTAFLLKGTTWAARLLR